MSLEILITVNSQMLACIYFCDFTQMDKKASLDLWFSYQNVTSYYCDTHLVTLFTSIKTLQ